MRLRAAVRTLTLQLCSSAALHALCTLQLQLCTLFALCVPCALRVHLRVCVTASQSVSTHGSVWRLCGLCS